MKKLLKPALFILPVLFLGISCHKDSSKIDQTQIFQKYTVDYNEATNVTTVKAVFSESKETGKNLELVGESNVTVNGTKLSFSGGTYSTTITGLVASADFVFTDGDKKTFSNSIVPSAFVGSTSSGYIDNGALSYWYFSNSVKSGDIVSVVVTNLADANKTITSKASVTGDVKVAFTTASISTIPSGDASVNITRSKLTSSGNFADAGGSISTSYKGLEKLVTVY